MTENRPRPSLDEAIAAFNRGEYFDAAEMFELAAPALEAELRDLAAALNRIAAALHMRFERGARQSSINLLSQAMAVLDEMKPERGGVDVERLFAEVGALTEEIRAEGRGERSRVTYRARIFLQRRRAPKITRRP